MIEHNIYQINNITKINIAYAIKAEVLLIIAEQDNLVNPLNSIILPKALKSNLVVLKGNNGHISPFIQKETAG